MRYYIRQNKTHVSGPYDVEDIKGWIRDGRVRSDAEFSVDGKEWIWGIELDLFPGSLKNEPRRRPA